MAREIDNTQYNLDAAIRKIPDFPKPGILFYDITSVLTNPRAFNYCLDQMHTHYKDQQLDAVAAIEARGFIFGAAFAARMGLPLILIRKKGKLPGETLSKTFTLEYGEDEIQVHKADVKKDARILVVDDLIATGGTLKATALLLEEAGATVSGFFGVIGLPFLNYADLLAGYSIHTLIDYHGE